MNQILISGYAKLPAHITSEEIYKTMVLAVLVDMDSRTIVKAEPSMVTELTKEFVSTLLVGYDLTRGPADLLERFESTYFGQAKKALETAVKMVFAKYDEIISTL